MAAVVQMERPPACQKLQPQTSIAPTMLVMVPITGIDVMKAERIDVKNPSIPNQYINPSSIAPPPYKYQPKSYAETKRSQHEFTPMFPSLPNRLCDRWLYSDLFFYWRHPHITKLKINATQQSL